MFMKAFEADGSMAGAIWGMIDEVFHMPEDIGDYISRDDTIR